MIYDSRGGAQKGRKTQIATAVIMIVIVIGFFLYTKINAPGENVADGIYSNECCGDISIENDRISQGGKTLPLRVRNMKFGLTGFVYGRFTLEGMSESNEETAITLFVDDDKRAISLPIDGHEYIFRRSEGSNIE